MRKRFSSISSLLWALIVTVILCTFAVHPGHTECQWETLTNAPAAGRVDDIFFLDENTGWCVNSSGHIWHTDDGGATWTKQFQSENYLRAIAFIDPLTGWAGVLDAPPRIFKTSDGGATWLPGAGLLPPGPPARICGMTVVDANTVIACGAFDGTPGYFQTDDGGANWTGHDLSAEVTAIVDVYFHDSQNGFLVGGADGAYPNDIKPVILQTTDGGANWTRRFTGTTAAHWCWKIFFLNDLVGWATVESLADASVLKTVDGGVTWQEYVVPNNTDIQGVGFIDENLGWVGGWEMSSESSDGGLTWNVIDDWGILLNRFVRFSPTLAYASGATVYKWTCGPSAVVQSKAPVPTPLALRSYPNPFNAATTIAFEVPSASHVRVRIYDGLGKRIVDLLNTELPAGPHSIEWDGRNAEGNVVASGVYLYRVDAAGTAESKSMVFAK